VYVAVICEVLTMSCIKVFNDSDYQSKPRILPLPTTETPWPEPAIELYLPSDRRLSAKLVSTFEERRCHVVSVTDLYDRILGFLAATFSFNCTLLFLLIVLTRLSEPRSRSTILRKSDSAGNRTRPLDL
jgi:hypothetical protein